MVTPEADRTIGAPSLRQGSPERFGYSWDHFHDITPEQELQFNKWTCLVDPQTGWRGKAVLDVGCGAGRNSVFAMRAGAARCLAIDVDERSLERARTNLSGFPNAEVRRLSAYDIDARDEFDLAFSIGVIHHLEAPAHALARMKQAVKPGGEVLIWVYGYENLEFYVNVLDPARKILFSWMPLGLARVIAWLPACALWLLTRLGFGSIDYLRQLKRFPLRHIHHIVFDQMLPRIANYWKEDEVRDLMEAAGLDDVRLAWVNQVSWTALGRKPAAR